MKKFKSSIDIWTCLIYLLILGGSLFFIYKGIWKMADPNGNSSILLGGLLLVLGCFFPAYFIAALVKTEYTFTENGLFVRFGFSKDLIPYKQIMIVKKCRKIFSLFSLSTKKLEIKYRNIRGTDSSWLHCLVSVKDEDAFIKELKVYCKSLKIEK